MLLLGDETVQSKYLPEIIAGRRGCNIALTEPGHGSALKHLETTATRDGDEFVVNGSKSYVTAAVVNDLHAVFVRFDGIAGAKGIGALIVEDGFEGVSVERGPTFVGDGGIPHGNVELRDARVPAENLIVGAGQFGRLMRAFNMERLHNCAFWLGAAEAAYDEAARYVQERQAFGQLGFGDKLPSGYDPIPPPGDMNNTTIGRGAYGPLPAGKLIDYPHVTAGDC